MRKQLTPPNPAPAQPVRAPLWLVALAAAGAIANPQAPQVANGQASFVQNGATLTITNSPGTIINWQSFGINRGELTRFVQQSAASTVLNRVVGNDASQILGSLQSNGRVFLINPNGIVFGQGSQVDVAGLVVSSLRLGDADFLAGRLRFTDTPGAGAVRTQGAIRTGAGGEVLLVAPQVENSGLIQAPDGKILLAAGRSVEVADLDKPGIRVEISNSTEQATNLGTLIARHVSIYGALVRNSGTIQANTAVLGEGGSVSLRARQAVLVEPGSLIEAKGPSGGTVLIQSDEGEARVQGTVSVRGELPLASALAPVATAPAGPAVARPSPVTPVLGAEEAAAPRAPVATPAPGQHNSAAPAPSTLAASAVHTPARPQPEPARPEPQSPALPPGAPGSGLGIGGNIRISGRSTMIGEGTVLDASGTLGGGEILVGGGWQGLNPNIINSQITYLAGNAQLFASAELRGNGGLVVVWANDTARVYGQIAARKHRRESAEVFLNLARRRADREDGLDSPLDKAAQGRVGAALVQAAHDQQDFF